MSTSRELKLPPRLYAIAKSILSLRKATVTEIARAVGRREQDIMRDIAELERRGLVTVSRRTYFKVELSERGKSCLSGSLPEEIVLRELTKSRRVHVATLKELGLSDDEIEVALGILRTLGVIKIREGVIDLDATKIQKIQEYIQNVKRELERYSLPRTLAELPDSIREVRRRGLVLVREHKEIVVEATNLLTSYHDKLTPGDIVTVVTPEIINLETWDSIEFKPFDLTIEPPRCPIARKHFFAEVINYMRDLMLSLGFEEVKGPHVELELWNFDALFVPQYHPSRRPTDVYIVNTATKEPPKVEQLVSTIGSYHKEFRGYEWNPSRALRLILRTHCTSVSVRTIWERGPGDYRVFTIDRVFRPDTPDPTHLMEFHQLDGIIVGERISFKDLLQFFREFARGLGLGEVRFKPAYFPFTEPSVEGYVKHPKLGWIEVLPGGMFRRQVLEPLGLKGYNVAAWGIGVDRVAMILLGISDIRDLYTDDVKEVEKAVLPKVILGASSIG
ncbi:MAG: phenylalanine--tRNA ligase subunit alpha [Sulfolobales archaeon]